MSVTLAVAAAAAVFSLGSGADTTVAVRRDTGLQINNFAGEVTVRTWERNAVRIQTDAGGNEKIFVRGSFAASRGYDASLLIKAYSQRGEHNSVDLDITAPTWMDLVVSGVHTDVSIEGTKGRVRVDTVHGDIVVVGGRGQIELNAINQDIHLTDASGTVLSETVNGDLTLQRIASDSVVVSTVNGEIFYEGTIRDRGTYQFTSHNGDIAIALPKAVNATVNVSTFSGEFASDFPVMLSETKRGRQFCFTIGKGSARVQLQSFQGTIHIFRPGTRGPNDGEHHDSDSDSDSDSDFDSNSDSNDDE
jgi:DUF4097 and DUF4098 domain-containing protein YvlB